MTQISKSYIMYHFLSIDILNTYEQTRYNVPDAKLFLGSLPSSSNAWQLRILYRRFIDLHLFSPCLCTWGSDEDDLGLFEQMLYCVLSTEAIVSEDNLGRIYVWFVLLYLYLTLRFGKFIRFFGLLCLIVEPTIFDKPLILLRAMVCTAGNLVLMIHITLF